MNPGVMRHRVTTVWRRRRAVRKLIRAAVWMLALLSAAATAAVWVAEDTPAAIGDDCGRYQDPDTLNLAKKYIHPAMDWGCAVCHLDCGQAPAEAGRESPPEYCLKMKEPELCLQCHAVLHPNLTAAHDDQPLLHSRCTGCHDAHASDNPLRLPEFSHGPYAARLCKACHDEPVDGDVRLVDATVKALCYGCHTDIRMRIDGAKSHHKLLDENDRSCMDCHDPHASNQESMLAKPVYELCIGCHTEKPEKASAPPPPPRESSGGMPSLQEAMQSQRFQELKAGEERKYIDLTQKYVHEPVSKSCTLCHDAHASEYTTELRATVYDLCMECHGDNAEKILKDSQPFPFLNGLVSLPPKSYKELPYLDLKLEFIHEPVSTSCVLCHDPHASDNEEKLYVPVHELCLGCHSDMNARRIMNSSQPIPLFGGKVLLPPKSFKKLSSLYLTRGGTYGHPVQNHPVYIPATDKKPELNCLTCHTSHAASTGLMRWKGSREEMCRQCHEM